MSSDIEEDRESFADRCIRYRDRLRLMVQLRLDQRLRGRVDASDVIQDVYLEATRRSAEFEKQEVPLWVWLRFLVSQRLALVHRHHLGVQARNAGREVSLHRARGPEASSEAIAAHLVSRLATPSQFVARAEIQSRLQESLNSMDPLDREVLVLRHFEQLSNTEVAEVLNINTSAASKRYLRALRRLQELLSDIPGSTLDQ